MTIISNNCAAWAIYKDLGVRYDSPTISLQILPQEYTKFCLSLKHYMECELKEYTELSVYHEAYARKLLGFKPNFPCGLLDDVLILFQHDKTFAASKEKWDRRKQRIDYSHIGYLFVLYHKDVKEAVEFGLSGLPHAALFTRDFDVNVPIEHHKYHLNEHEEYLQRSPFHRYFIFEEGFDRERFLKEVGG